MSKIIIACAVTGGQLAVSNVQQVEKIVRIIREMGHEPATPTEVRSMLNLKGGDREAF
jgi:uncharacterized protein (DUF849 family)